MDNREDKLDITLLKILKRHNISTKVAEFHIKRNTNFARFFHCPNQADNPANKTIMTSIKINVPKTFPVSLLELVLPETSPRNSARIYKKNMPPVIIPSNIIIHQGKTTLLASNINSTIMIMVMVEGMVMVFYNFSVIFFEISLSEAFKIFLSLIFETKKLAKCKWLVVTNFSWKLVKDLVVCA